MSSVVVKCGSQTWACAVADNTPARVAGLERFPVLPRGSGLIFDWSGDRGREASTAATTRTFRHGDVPYPIRIAWITKGRVVHAVTSTPPDRGQRYSAAADWVLEVNAAEGAGLVCGARVERVQRRTAQAEVVDDAALASHLAAAALSLPASWQPDANNQGGTSSLVVTAKLVRSWAEVVGVDDPDMVASAALADDSALERLGDALVGSGFADQVNRRGQYLICFRFAGRS